MAKPRGYPFDPHQMVIESLARGEKKPAEIEEDLRSEARHRYTYRIDLSEQEKKDQVDKDTIKLRSIEYVLRELQDKGEVAQEKPFGKYFLTDKIFDNPKFAAAIFGKLAISKLMESNAVSKSPFVSLDDDDVSDNYIDAESIFRFANDVGALITYVLLDAMNPEYTNHLDNGRAKDDFVLEKIGNVIRIHALILEFCKMEIIKRGQAVYNPIPIRESLPPDVRDELLRRQKRRRHFDPNNPKWSRYEMDKTNFQKAMNSFASAYPHAFEFLERVKRAAPTTIHLYKSSYKRSLRNDREKKKKEKERIRK